MHPLLLQREKRIVIRSQDMIVAEHLPATEAGSTVADPLHLEALWKLSLLQRFVTALRLIAITRYRHSHQPAHPALAGCVVAP
jgi:hypothetical protein